jgi:hypothetical protein
MKLTVCAAGVLTALPLVFSPAASASPTPHINGVFINHTSANYVNIRPCARISSSCAPVGQAQMSHSLIDYCFVLGDYFEGTSYWDYVYDQNTGKSGYITEARLDDAGQGQAC